MRKTAIAHIEGRFPGVHCWWGLYTSHWWAYIPTSQGGRLIEASTPNILVARITQLLA
jgi:hypothetical protein